MTRISTINNQFNDVKDIMDFANIDQDSNNNWQFVVKIPESETICCIKDCDCKYGQNYNQNWPTDYAETFNINVRRKRRNSVQFALEEELFKQEEELQEDEERRDSLYSLKEHEEKVEDVVGSRQSICSLKENEVDEVEVVEERRDSSKEDEEKAECRGSTYSLKEYGDEDVVERRDSLYFSKEQEEDEVEDIEERRDSLYFLRERDENVDVAERRDNLYSLEEHEEDEVEDVSKKRDKKTEKSSTKHFLKSILSKKKNPKENQTEPKARKRLYSSNLDISSTKPLTRSSSFLKKKIEDGASFIKRSLSFRDLSKKKESDRLTEIKDLAKSMHSLVKNEVCVKEKDLSFVDYDVLNTFSYKDNNKYKIWRTQSMVVNGSVDDRKLPNFIRGTSIAGDSNQYRHEINVNTGAISLPSLTHLENVSPEPSPTHKYQRRAQSVNSEDGSRVCPSASTGSFRSAGSGCAKLKRHNACRQKNKNATVKSFEDEAVRSRSLNHLDTLEMRQGVPSPTDGALKDAKSEPDCTRPLLVPANIPAPADSPSPQRPEPPHRRHMLSRSQKSSSECFSVNFEVGEESTFDTELFYPATRGTTLYDSLYKQCELRFIDLSSCDAWLWDKENGTQSWLSLLQDTACLVGKHVRITQKDSAAARNKLGTLQGHSRKLSASAKSKGGSSFFSTSTEETGGGWQVDGKIQDSQDYKKQTKQRWSALFGNSKDSKQQMEQLIDQLQNYSKFAVPSCQVYPMGQSEAIDALYKIEQDWRDIIDVTKLSEKQQKQQTAMWELIQTEVAYIKTLKLVTDLFLACLQHLQSSNILKEIDTGKLFSNISDILEANVQFWSKSLYPLVRDMRRYKQPACVETMCEGFLNINESFHAYYQFCGERSRCLAYFRENMQKELFAAYLLWCETQKECNRLKLLDILVQPMQRLTKYGLLLKAILKNTDDEVERDNLDLMIRSVDNFVNNVNFSLKQKQDNERLKGIIARIESYDIVESKDDDLEKLVKSYNHLDLNKPMLNCPPERRRHLLLEGDLKLKDNNTSKMEVHCFLLTDMLLVCKASTKKGGSTMRLVRQPYLVDRLVVTEINKETPTLACVYKNEFDMAVAAFLLQNNDPNKLKSWKDGLLKAQNLYYQAKHSYLTEESLDTDYSFEYCENDVHCLQLAPRSPLASSSRASRVSSLAHSHSGSVEMNDQSSIGSAEKASRAVSVENDNRTASISSDEGVQPLPPDKSPVSQKNSFKHRLFNKTPNTLSVQPITHSLGQSLPNLALGSPNVGTLNLNFNQNTLSVPSTSKNGHLLSPTHRGISYPPPSPTRGNLRRGLAISQSKNPPLIKTRHVISASSVGPAADVPVIAGSSTEQYENFCRGHHRQAMVKRFHRNDNKRYHTAGAVDDIKKCNTKDSSIHKRLSWNCSQEPSPPNPPEDQT